MRAELWGGGSTVPCVATDSVKWLCVCAGTVTRCWIKRLTRVWRYCCRSLFAFKSASTRRNRLKLKLSDALSWAWGRSPNTWSSTRSDVLSSRPTVRRSRLRVRDHTHSLTYSLSHPLTHSPTHSLTYSLKWYFDIFYLYILLHSLLVQGASSTTWHAFFMFWDFFMFCDLCMMCLYVYLCVCV